MNIVTQQLTEEMFARRNEVAMLVASLTGVPVDDIMGRCRRQRIADARKLVMWALAVMCGYTRNNVGILMDAQPIDCDLCRAMGQRWIWRQGCGATEARD